MTNLAICGFDRHHHANYFVNLFGSIMTRPAANQANVSTVRYAAARKRGNNGSSTVVVCKPMQGLLTVTTEDESEATKPG